MNVGEENPLMSTPCFRSYVSISRSRIADNFRKLRDVVGPGVTVCGVVKADAYGHGALEVSRILEQEGVTWLAVSSVEEGVALRRSGRTARILVMAGFLRHEREALLEYDLTPAAHSIEDIAELEQFAASRGKPLAYHLKIDSGMGRLGTRACAEQIIAAIEAASNVHCEGLMTHFASAADYDSLQTEHQAAAFCDLRDKLQQAGIAPRYFHTSSTTAIAYGRRDAWHSMVRPGIALYGYVSPARGEAPPRILNVKPALEWKAKILVVKDVPEGALVGYGGSFRAPRPMRIGVLAVGYADGLPHRLSNKGRIIADGKAAAILGTVSMDLTTLDLTHTQALKPGDEVTLLGQEGDAKLDAQQIGRLAGTISYNILCGIGARVRRVYVD
jgi:alanine racemase